MSSVWGGDGVWEDSGAWYFCQDPQGSKRWGRVKEWAGLRRGFWDKVSGMFLASYLEGDQSLRGSIT